MVVADLHIVGVTFHEAETNTSLVIDRDRILPFSVTARYIEAITRKNFQIFKACRQVHVFQLPVRTLRDIGWQSFRPSGRIKLTSGAVCESFDHTSDCVASRDERQSIPHCRLVHGGTKPRNQSLRR